MGTGILTAILVGALSAAPPAGGGEANQATSSTKPAESQRPPTSVPDHALSGVVKSIEATRLVITRTGKHSGDMTFVLSSATQREGALVVGARVQIRFRTEGRTQVATAVRALPPKQPAGENAPSGPALVDTPTEHSDFPGSTSPLMRGLSGT
jgi:hypothetical protein